MTAVRSISPKMKKTELQEGFQPGKHHVVCGRGKQSYHHAGNRRFRLAVALSIHEYQRARTRFDKTLVVIGVVDSFRDAGGGFVKRNYKKAGEHWFEIGDRVAREKVGHAIRDAMSAKESEANSFRGFSKAVSLSELIAMSPKELESTEMELKMGVFDDSKENQMPCLSSSSSIPFDGCLVRPTEVTSSSSTSISNSNRSEPTTSLSPSKLPIPCETPSSNQINQAEDLCPIKLEEVHDADVSLLGRLFSLRREVSLCGVISRGSFTMAKGSSLGDMCFDTLELSAANDFDTNLMDEDLAGFVMEAI